MRESPVPVRRLGGQVDLLGEGPAWCPRRQALYWVDLRRPSVRRLDATTGEVATWTMPGFVGSLALCGDGRILVAIPGEIARFDPLSGTFETVARIDLRPDQRFNDGKCDPRGRFWVGTLNDATKAPEGTLYRLDPDGRLAPMLGALRVPNGLAWSPDGRTMYFTDSPSRAILAYDFDVASSALGARRVFARVEPPGVPDGATVDAEGFLWSAEYGGWRITRYAPDGRVERRVPLPVQRPTSCAFGGAGLDVLFVTTASQRLSLEELAAQPLAGALLALDPGVRGLPEPRFGPRRPPAPDR